MFTVHSDGLIAGDVFESPVTAIKAGFLGLFGGGTDDPPSLEEPAADAKLTKSEAWWRDHVAQFLLRVETGAEGAARRELQSFQRFGFSHALPP